MHQRRILETVARSGSVSRSNLARATGMSQPTVSRIVDRLLSAHILAESDNEAPSTVNGSDKAAAVLGRPSTRLELDRRRPRFGIVQLGVRNTRLAVIPLAIPAEDRWQAEFPTPASADAWLRQLARVWKPYRDKGLKALVSLPGVVDERTGKVYLSPNVRWLERADLGDGLRDIFGPALAFKQEIRLLALGQLAAEPESGDFLLVDSGNGVGAAAVIGGNLFGGSVPLSGEIGHVAVPGNDRRCGCGAVGCLETLISRPGFVASAAEHGQPKSWPALIEYLTDKPLPRWLKQSLESTAVDVAAALNLLGLRQVILTGAFRELPPGCVEYLTEAVRQHAMWARFGEISVRTAPRRRQAGVISVALDRMLLG
ncbi:MAG TPA: ROK family transcriptional regulator [Gemmataceae bacterium]|nr:ROK family transcriptional regulator [Gemmataceae bacterium]